MDMFLVSFFILQCVESVYMISRMFLKPESNPCGLKKAPRDRNFQNSSHQITIPLITVQSQQDVTKTRFPTQYKTSLPVPVLFPPEKVMFSENPL